MRRAELLAFTTHVSESVPPIAAVWAVVLVLGSGKLAPRLRLWQSQLVLLYVFLTIATAMLSAGTVRLFFPFLTAAQYFSETHPEYGGFLHWLRFPFFPKGNEVMRTFYEGAEREAVPWGAWALPLALWLAFFMVFFWTASCLLAVFRRQWHNKERLGFPLAQFGLTITGQRKDFYRNPLMWAGFLGAGLFTLTNVLGAFNPSVPHLGRSWGVVFPERPWSGMSMGVVYLPAVFGLAWLAPLDVNLSVWMLYLLARVENTMGWLLGSQSPGIPYEHYQAVGAYVGLFLLTLWAGRGLLREARREVRNALAGLFFLVAFAALTGLGFLAAAVLIGTVLAFAVVYAKMRSEAGVPILWAIPYFGQHDVLRGVLPPAVIGPRGLTLLAAFRFLTRGCSLALPAYQSDATEMAASAKIPQRHMASTVMAATAVGLVLAAWVHLTSYYRYGCNVLETNNPSQGGDSMSIPLETYDGLAGDLSSRAGQTASWPTWAGVGLASVLGMSLLRKRFFRFPLHPMGFVLAMTCGGSVWGMYLFAWLAKALTVRVGGLRLYQALTPLMLGVVFGEFFAGGAWSFVSMMTPEWAHKWVIFYR